MNFSKSALDRLGERLRKGEVIATEDAAGYEAYRLSFTHAMREAITQASNAIDFADPPSSRFKTLESVVAKLRRTRTRLSVMQDIAGLRFTVPSLHAQELAAGMLGDAFLGCRVTDYRETPQNGCRAIHIIAPTRAGRHVEIQIRTQLQSQWANISEQAAGRYGTELKYGAGDPELLVRLNALSETGRELERMLESLGERLGDFDAMQPGEEAPGRGGGNRCP